MALKMYWKIVKSSMLGTEKRSSEELGPRPDLNESTSLFFSYKPLGGSNEK